jgi:hypothetical protein
MSDVRSEPGNDARCLPGRAGITFCPGSTHDRRKDAKKMCEQVSQ